jgi:NAD(P)-dependent dehydrogenase (short-subunit alcohol dehydrogenase family)
VIQKTALFLGGTSGLGQSLAVAAARGGFRTILYGRSGKPAVEELQEAIYRPLDLIDRESVERAELGQERVHYLFWVAGRFLQKPLARTSQEELDGMIDLHLRGPARFLSRYLHFHRLPIHVVTIASSSSWRLRRHETLYCALKAAQAALSRNLAVELAEERTGSKVTVINPGGLKVPKFWEGTDQDISGFLEPNLVAERIWELVLGQRESYLEAQILRRKPPEPGGEPIVELGPKLPEVPR